MHKGGFAEPCTTAISKNKYVSIIQKTHQELRRRFAESDNFDLVWKSHCSNNEHLEEYSLAMKQLATHVWADNCDGQDRTTWCRDLCIKYFYNGKLQELLMKDKRRFLYFKSNPENFLPSNLSMHLTPDQNSIHCNDYNILFNDHEKIKLLDVGSCHNPFFNFSEFETVAIDISPATDSVYKCDFLTVNINKNSDKIGFAIPNTSISDFPASYFQVVVFSLLLSYLPCPKSRLVLCKKAYEVLQTNGLLLIITPDSSHQNRHAKLMKNWKNVIENIGFQRIVYEKDKHMHFMAFRKVPKNFIWDKRKNKFYTDQKHFALHIPQDFSG